METVHERYGRFGNRALGLTPIDPATWRGTALVPAAVAALHRLLQGATTGTASDGAGLVRLRDGRVVAVICTEEEDIRVKCMSAEDDGYFIFMSEGFLKSLFALIAGLWTCGGVMPSVGRVPAGSRYAIAAIAPGFEHLAWMIHADLKGGKVPQGFTDADWERLLQRASREVAGVQLHHRLQALCPMRRSLFEASFLAAVDFVWLHEIAHILCGHLDANVVRQLGLDMAESTPEPIVSLGNIPSDGSFSHFHYGVEIEADVWAVHRIAAQRAHRESSDMICARLLGVVAVFMLFYGNNVLRDQPDYALKHPPIWYRAVLAIRGAAPSSQVGRILDELHRIAHIHPLFGEWLDPIARGDGFRAAAVLEARVAEEFTPWLAELRLKRNQFDRG